VDAIVASDPSEALASTTESLAAVTAIQRHRILDRLMEGAVTILDPASTYIEDTVTIGADTTIYPNVVIEGPVGDRERVRRRRRQSRQRLTIGDRVTLLPYCVLRSR